MLGYFAGLLYNPNNVSPEAAPVTVKWEFEVGADILKMVGYNAPPKSGETTREEFGWAHVTGGGTVANLEALWIARNVRYFPLSVREVCRRHKIPLTSEALRIIATRRSIFRRSRRSNASASARIRRFICTRAISTRCAATGRSRILEAIRCAHELIAESEFNIAHQGLARRALGAFVRRCC